MGKRSEVLARLLCGLASMLGAAGAAASERPNIVVIVADDVGYSDLQSYGGEIRTPNLAALAEEGTTLTSFYVAPTCSPTRAMLLSGTDHHLAGVGTMGGSLPATPEVQGMPGYEGHLDDRVVTAASLLRDAGYRTYMTGKWHLGAERAQAPDKRGFDKSFVLLEGGASHFGDGTGILSPITPARYRQDGEPVASLPEDFFSSRFYTDRMIEYIDAQDDEDRPFFAYLAFTAPHWPLQVPDDWLDRYAGRYDEGYDVLRAERLARMRELGLIAPGTEAFPRLDRVPAWDTLTATEKKVYARRMELYAAMVENLDHHVGRLIAHLKAIGEYDNTFVLFMSDNGPEGNDMSAMLDNEVWIPANFDNRYENMGREGSYVWLGPGFGQVSALPYRLYKSFTAEGGIRVPAIVRHPGRPAGGKRSDAFMSVMDVLPTALELAGAEHPGARYRGRDVLPMRGASMLAHLEGRAQAVHPPDHTMGWELFGRRALRQGDWKILWLWEPYGPGRWQLYDLAADPAETRDLAAERPDKLGELIAAWQQYVHETGVIVLDSDRGYAD